MKNEIVNHIDQPKVLEKMYQDNKVNFKKEFNVVYPEIENNPIAMVWHERLNYENNEISWGSPKELSFVIIASLLAGFIAKIPEPLGLKPEYFYPRNIGFIIFPILSAYFAWKNQLPTNKIRSLALASLAAVIYINILPNNTESDTLLLSCIHLPLFLWSILGFTFISKNIYAVKNRLDFLRYNGDLVVITILILLAGGLLTGITIGLFTLIGFDISNFYFEYIVVFGLAASPIVGTYVVQTNPQLVNKVSPVIAKIFTPLVLITLVIYLLAIMVSGKDPYKDREFLMLFNALLLGVMAIILFSIAETARSAKSKLTFNMLFLLSVLTIIVNSIALSAILFRISEWGISPNRLAVLGGNILILINLILVSINLFKATKNAEKIELVENSIATFLPFYSAWTIIVTFIFPFAFGFK